MPHPIPGEVVEEIKWLPPFVRVRVPVPVIVIGNAFFDYDYEHRCAEREYGHEHAGGVSIHRRRRSPRIAAALTTPLTSLFRKGV